MAEKEIKHMNFDEVFRYLDIVMATMGLHKLYQPGKLLTKFRFFQWILCIITASNLSFLLVGVVIFVITSESTLDILEAMPNIFVTTIALVKLATLIVRREAICELTNDLKALWPRAEDESAIKRFHKIVSPTLKLCMFYSAVTIGTAFAFGMTPILDATMEYVQFGEAHMKMAFSLWYPFDYEKSIPLFAIVFFSQFWGALSSSNLMATVDMFMCILISLLCYHFETISDSLKAIQPTTSDIDDFEIIEITNSCLMKCILYHCRLLRLCKLLEEIFSFAMFVNLTIMSITICEVLFNIMMVPPDKTTVYILYIGSASVEVFMLCWYSDKLIQQSSDLTSAAYQCGWYNSDKKFTMNLIQLQIRTQKPVALTAMKFFVLSVNAFLHIATSTWSYFTLLRQLYGK